MNKCLNKVDRNEVAFKKILNISQKYFKVKQLKALLQ